MSLKKFFAAKKKKAPAAPEQKLAPEPAKSPCCTRCGKPYPKSQLLVFKDQRLCWNCRNDLFAPGEYPKAEDTSVPKQPAGEKQIRRIHFAQGSFAYTLEKVSNGFHLFHRPTDRYDWSPIIDVDLPGDYFKKHTVDQFCSYVETLTPNSAKLHRGMMKDRLIAAGFMEKPAAKPKKPASAPVSPHQHDLRYQAEQAILAQMTEQNYKEIIEELETYRKTNCIIQKAANRLVIDQYLPDVNLRFEVKRKDGIFTLFQGGDHGAGDRTGFGETITLTPEQIANKKAFISNLHSADAYVTEQLWDFTLTKLREMDQH